MENFGQDGDSSTTTHETYLVLLKIKGFPVKATEGKIVLKYCNMSTIQGRGSPPLYHSLGVTLRVRPRIKFVKRYNKVLTKKHYIRLWLDD